MYERIDSYIYMDVLRCVADYIAVRVSDDYLWIRCDQGWWCSKDKEYHSLDEFVADDILENVVNGTSLHGYTTISDMRPGTLENFEVPTEIVELYKY